MNEYKIKITKEFQTKINLAKKILFNQVKKNINDNENPINFLLNHSIRYQKKKSIFTSHIKKKTEIQCKISLQLKNKSSNKKLKNTKKKKIPN